MTSLDPLLSLLLLLHTYTDVLEMKNNKKDTQVLFKWFVSITYRIKRSTESVWIADGKRKTIQQVERFTGMHNDAPECTVTPWHNPQHSSELSTLIRWILEV